MSTATEWGVPDWRDETAYPRPDQISDKLWRWEFIRRMQDYRKAWDIASKAEYEILCRMAEKRQGDKARIRRPDDLYFSVSLEAFSSPEKYHDLIKYEIQPFPNPRIRIPRVFEEGPSIIHFSDEDGGYFALKPSDKHRVERVSIRAGWTMIQFDLTEPIDKQLHRASNRLRQIQSDFADEIGFAAKLKQKAARRQRKDMWPLYLRVLDARNQDVAYETIGRTLRKLESNVDKMSRADADATLNNIERAKSDAKKWHVAALKVANRNPR
jgi:hypothetical protein